MYHHGVVVDKPWIFDGSQREAEVRFRDLDAEVRSWAGVAAAVAAAMVALVAEAVRDRLWERCGYPSLAQWVALRCGVSAAHAKRLIAIAETLEALPLVREQFAAGKISEDHVVEIARAGVTAFHDHDAAGFSSEMTVGQLRKALSFLPAAPDRAPEPEPSPSKPVRRGDQDWLRVGHGRGGRWEIHGACSSERGALLERALQAGRDREYRDRHGRDPDPGVPVDQVSDIDGLLRMASDALDVADPATRAGRAPSERYLVNVHVHVHDRGDGRLHLGPRLPGWMTEEISCDASIRAWLHPADGSVGLGRRCRVVSDRLRAVVEHRDGGCVTPGCEQTRHLHVHPIVHWQHGGPTELRNLVCLCAAHHRDVHLGRVVIAGNPEAGALTISRADGAPFDVGHPSPPPADAVEQARAAAARTPARAGEKCQWKWVDWRPVRPPPPPPPPSPPTPPRTYEWPTIDPNTIWPGN